MEEFHTWQVASLSPGIYKVVEWRVLLQSGCEEGSSRPASAASDPLAEPAPREWRDVVSGTSSTHYDQYQYQ